MDILKLGEKMFELYDVFFGKKYKINKNHVKFYSLVKNFSTIEYYDDNLYLTIYLNKRIKLLETIRHNIIKKKDIQGNIAFWNKRRSFKEIEYANKEMIRCRNQLIELGLVLHPNLVFNDYIEFNVKDIEDWIARELETVQNNYIRLTEELNDIFEGVKK